MKCVTFLFYVKFRLTMDNVMWCLRSKSIETSASALQKISTQVHGAIGRHSRARSNSWSPVVTLNKVFGRPEGGGLHHDRHEYHIRSSSQVPSNYYYLVILYATHNQSLPPPCLILSPSLPSRRRPSLDLAPTSAAAQRSLMLPTTPRMLASLLP
jgi:hypothetical protein